MTQRITTLADQWRIQALFMDITLMVTVAPKNYIANIAAAHTHSHGKRERESREEVPNQGHCYLFFFHQE